MRALVIVLLTLVFLPTWPSAQAPAEKTLDVYFIDVEGGHATLYVSPSGQSMLVDAGYSGFGGRDADRIVAAATRAGLKQIDYLVVTHYHGDHVGGCRNWQRGYRFATSSTMGRTRSVESAPMHCFSPMPRRAAKALTSR